MAKQAKGGIIKNDLLNIRSILKAVIWNIWLERNRRIFSNAHLNTNALFALIENNIVLWTGTTGEEAVAGSSTGQTRREVRRSLDMRVYMQNQ